MALVPGVNVPEFVNVVPDRESAPLLVRVVPVPMLRVVPVPLVVRV